MTRGSTKIGVLALAGTMACACVIDASDEDTGVSTLSGTEGGGTATDGGPGGSQTSETAGEQTSGGSGGSSTDSATSSNSSGDDASATDATTAGSDSGGSEGDGGSSSGDTGAGQGGGTIDVTLTGCDVDLGGTVVVSYNGSLGVASIYDMGATLSGSFQFDLDGTGVMQLSSQHRVDTGNVVNLVDVAQGTWTNLDADALTGAPDTIGGTLTINAWDPAAGISDLQLDGVSLLNTVNGNVCTIDGTIVTDQLYP